MKHREIDFSKDPKDSGEGFEKAGGNGSDGRDDGASKPNAFGIILALVLIAAVVSISVAVFFKAGATSSGRAPGELIEGLLSGKAPALAASRDIGIDTGTSEHTAFCIHNDSIIICTSEIIRSIGKNGAEEWSRVVSLSNPAALSSGNGSLLVADIGGRHIYVFSGSSVRWETDSPENIISVHISEGGIVSVVREAKGFRNAVDVYDPDGTLMFSRNIADNYIIGAGVSPSGKRLLIRSVDAAGPALKTVFEYFDMAGKPVAAKKPPVNGIFGIAGFTSGGSAVAACSGAVAFFSQDGENDWMVGYDKVYSASVINGKLIAAAVSGAGRTFRALGGADGGSAGVPANEGSFDTGGGASVLEIMDERGRRTAAVKIGAPVKNIRAFRDITAVNTGREIYFIDSKGRVSGRYSSTAEIIDAGFFSRDEAAVFSKSKVVVLYVRH